jgi:flagellar hook-length control protein FliK
MTSAISRAANAAHAHGFAKSVKNETPVEGFEALFAAVANPVVTPVTPPVSGEHGKPGDGARDDEKKGSASAFELAASLALVAANGDRSEVRTVSNADVAHSVAQNVIETSQPSLPRVASNARSDLVVSAPVRPVAYVPILLREDTTKSESAVVPTAQPSRSVPNIQVESHPTNSTAPKPSVNALPAKTTPMPTLESEAVVANVATRAMPEPEAYETPTAPLTTTQIMPASPQPAPRPRVILSPRALAQAAIVEAIRSPGRGRSRPEGEGAPPTANDADPIATPTLPSQAATAPVAPASTAAAPIAAPPIAETMTLLADASPSIAKPVGASPTPSKPTAASRAAADILRQRPYALGTDASPVGDIVPESAAAFDTLIALRKADGALEGHASPAGEHEPAALASSSPWLPNLPSSAPLATTSASAIVAPRVFDPTAWSAALAQQVTASVIAAAKETTIRVEPEGLGPIEVRVRVTSEHVDVRFAIEHPVTVNMVRAALPDLEKMLAQSGLNLGDAQVAQQNAGQRHQTTPHRNAVSNVRDDEPVVMASPIESRPRARVGLLDDFV